MADVRDAFRGQLSKEILDLLVQEVAEPDLPVGTVPVFSNATRPAASSVPLSYQIWNTDDNAPNFSDGTNWRDAAGNIT